RYAAVAGITRKQGLQLPKEGQARGAQVTGAGLGKRDLVGIGHQVPGQIRETVHRIDEGSVKIEHAYGLHQGATPVISSRTTDFCDLRPRSVIPVRIRATALVPRAAKHTMASG